MKVLNLQCSHGHGFEGWFASNEAFETQLAGGLVECPLCGGKEIEKRLSAPRLNLGAGKEPAAPAPATPDQNGRWLRSVVPVLLLRLLRRRRLLAGAKIQARRAQHLGDLLAAAHRTLHEAAGQLRLERFVRRKPAFESVAVRALEVEHLHGRIIPPGCPPRPAASPVPMRPTRRSTATACR